MEVFFMSQIPYKYDWVKLPRNIMPKGTGILKDFFELAYACAYKSGVTKYNGYYNKVKANQWAGGLDGIRRLLKKRTKEDAYDALIDLSLLGLITVETFKYRYIVITVHHIIPSNICTEEIDFYHEYLNILSDENRAKILENTDNNPTISHIKMHSKKCYVNNNSGFVRVERNVSNILFDNNRTFSDADAFFDLYLHTVYREQAQPFSENYPAILFEKNMPILTLEVLAKRWLWDKQRVYRFFKRYSKYFKLIKLQSSYGCVIFNTAYPIDDVIITPTQDDCFVVVNRFKNYGDGFFRSDEIPANQNKYINLCFYTFANFVDKKDLVCIEEEVIPM